MTQTITTKKISILTIVSIILSLFVYLYSYQVSLSNAMTIQEIEGEILNLKSKISETEFLVVENKRKIDKSLAIADGFTETKEIKFVRKNQDTALNASTN
jgi:hypothetical protein